MSNEALEVLRLIVRDVQAKLDEGDSPLGHYISGEYWTRAVDLLNRPQPEPDEIAALQQTIDMLRAQLAAAGELRESYMITKTKLITTQSILNFVLDGLIKNQKGGSDGKEKNSVGGNEKSGPQLDDIYERPR